ncbi:alpha/beta hydrolase fold protein [Stanieria cyanosphaera PCC 7437]|uniref:Monoacylglycerol lipase n=1 Tax=Stanieria cyanosphaera (strain ATCC 29371 / PCC 7437) TaxID=111780 RepID=K9XY23_STAC7|nr:alpha/beta hydrolase [Stanieria cyanosphaera]AFZ37001.1 alpha/beta hydrolase fold protein [Stanieria cyanosphaera PCC 7437]
MKHWEGTFPGANGLNLYCQSWHPQTLAKAVLVIIPGHGGHSGIFTKMIKYLIERDYIVYSFDLRGNGRSPGQRGYINNWAEFRADLKAFLHLVKTKEPELPLFVIGQSLGGTIALDYVLREPSNQLKGLILIAPALGLGVNPWKILIGKLLSRILPHFSLDTGIDFSASSRDPEVVAACAQDTLRHSQGTARLATELLKTIDWIYLHVTELQIPLLILHGGADRVTLSESSRLFFERLTLADKEIREYPDSYHELHNDLNYQEVLTDIKDWLNRN